MMDDRGQRVKVLNPAGFQDWPVRGDPRMEGLVRRVGLAMEGAGWRKRMMLRVLPGVVSMALVGTAVGGLQVVYPGAPRWALIVAVVFAMTIGMTWLIRVKASANAAAVADVVLEEGLCPSCGYNFHGLAAGADGCVVCPECSAAWRGARMARTAEFIAGAGAGDTISAMRKGLQSATMWTTVDDRWRRVDLVHPRLRKALNAAQGDDSRSIQLLRARARIGRGAMAVRVFGLGIVWMLVMLAVGAACYLAWSEGPRLFGICAGVALVFGVGGVWATVGNFCYPPSKTRNAMVAEGLCATCAGNLRAVAEDEGGLRVCPGCRSAWRVPDQVSAERSLS